MNLTLQDTREASYKEAVFILESSSASGGRKNVIHEFVNSDKQVIEDLGLLRKSYSITAIITGEDYERKKLSLLSALQDGEKGTFVHPFEGNIEDMTVITFSLSEDFKSFGVATFQIELKPSDDISSPVRSFFTVSEVEAKTLETGLSISDTIAELYTSSANLTGSIENNIDKANSFIRDFTSATDGITGFENIVNRLNGLVIGFKKSAASLVQKPVDLGESILDLFTTSNESFPSASLTLIMMQKLFDFGRDDQDQLNIKTAGIIEINKNNDVFNYSINAFALAYAYMQISRADFSTVEDIERQEQILEKQYDFLMGISSLSVVIRRNLTILRGITSDVITELKTTTPDLIKIEITNALPIRVLEFERYNESERTQSLISINELNNIGQVKGGVFFLNDNL